MASPAPVAVARHRGGISPGRPRHARAGRSPDPDFMPACQRALGEQCQPRAAAGAGRGRHQRLHRHRRGPGGAGPAARHGRRIAPPARHGAGRRLDPPVRRPGRTSSTPRRSATSADRRLSGAGPPPADQRHAHPCRDRGRGPAHRPDEPGQLLPAASAGAVDQLAVLGRPGDRPEVDPAHHLRRPATLRLARALRELARVAATCSRSWPTPACVEDATQIWWDIRPSAKHPTLELRITDICTDLEDALTIAALYQSLLHHLWRLRARNQSWRIYRRILIEENKWRAQRWGIEAELADFGAGCLKPMPTLVDELIELLRDDAAELGCLRRAGAGPRHRGGRHQRRPAARRLPRGIGRRRAAPTKRSRAVVDWLIAGDRWRACRPELSRPLEHQHEHLARPAASSISRCPLSAQ